MGFSKCGWSCFVGNWGILLKQKGDRISALCRNHLLTSRSSDISVSSHRLLLKSLALGISSLEISFLCHLIPSHLTSLLLISSHLISSHLFSCHHVIISCDLIWVNLVSSHLSSCLLIFFSSSQLSSANLISCLLISSLFQIVSAFLKVERKHVHRKSLPARMPSRTRSWAMRVTDKSCLWAHRHLFSPENYENDEFSRRDWAYKPFVSGRIHDGTYDQDFPLIDEAWHQGVVEELKVELR